MSYISRVPDSVPNKNRSSRSKARGNEGDDDRENDAAAVTGAHRYDGHSH